MNRKTRMLALLLREIPLKLRRVSGSWMIAAGLSILPAYGQINATVDSRMDIYQAGGNQDSSDGIPPFVLTFSPHLEGVLQIRIPAVGGAWSCHEGFPEYGADGQSMGQCLTAEGPTNLNSTGPFSGIHITDAQGPLVGVFLSNATLPPPPDLRFFVKDDSLGGTETNFRNLAPRIGQVFFIGDGLTGTETGTLQTFQVPAGASHLYLGYAETCKSTGAGKPGCYADNTGTITISLRLQNYQNDWVPAPTSMAPGARIGPAITYDQKTHSTVLFGGSGAFIPGPTYNDTWVWRDGWRQKQPVTSPPARQAAGMAYDPTTGTIVMFGGWDNSNNGSTFGDTWTWDGVNWTQQFPPVSPPARNARQAISYDPISQTVVLFGGMGPDNGRYGGNPFGDTWQWNGRAKTWTQVFPASSPSPRAAPIVLDSANNTIVLFGGDNGCGDGCRTIYNDTWTWNGVTWTQKFPPSSPAVRTYHMMAYDSNLRQVVVFGGSQSPPSALNDTWSWNGQTWVNLLPPDQPASRFISSMDFDPISNGLLLFGGELTGDVVTNQTWLYRLTPLK